MAESARESGCASERVPQAAIDAMAAAASKPIHDDGHTDCYYAGLILAALPHLEVVPASVERERDEARAELERRQEAIDAAFSAMNGSAYVGGPSEREAWQTALRELGSVVTQHQGADASSERVPGVGGEHGEERR